MGSVTTFYGSRKSELCFHFATVAAEMDPETPVLVVDACPRRQVSKYLLAGDGRKGTLLLASVCNVEL